MEPDRGVLEDRFALKRTPSSMLIGGRVFLGGSKGTPTVDTPPKCRGRLRQRYATVEIPPKMWGSPQKDRYPDNSHGDHLLLSWLNVCL